MRVSNKAKPSRLEAGIIKTLGLLRERRNFEAESYIEAKCTLLNEYMLANQLKACVVGLSGGIDSAVVLGILNRASQQKGSPLQKLVPLAMPVYTQGATNQHDAVKRALLLAKHFGLDALLVDLTHTVNALKQAINGEAAVKDDAWAEGQLVSYIRAPALYYMTSLLAAQGVPAIVVGTTNRDEGAYLGFFGKASDGMVDIQLISDLHKSEVINVAQTLNIPESILKAAPTGDMYDGRTDEEVFGAPYDFVELYIALRCLEEGEKEHLTCHWNEADREQYAALAERLENLHHYNAHKYKVGSPAVHLDILESQVPGGWQHGPLLRRQDPEPEHHRFVAPFALSAGIVRKLHRKPQQLNIAKRALSVGAEITIIAHHLSVYETAP